MLKQSPVTKAQSPPPRAPGAHLKVIQTLVQRGEFPKILAYCKKVNYTPEWPHLLAGILNMNPDGAVQLAVSLNEMDPPPVLPNQVVEMPAARLPPGIWIWGCGGGMGGLGVGALHPQLGVAESGGRLEN